MNSKSNDIKKEAPDSAVAKPASSAQAEVKPIAAEKPKPKPSGFQRFVRSSLTWLIVVVLAFLAGLLTLFFTLYQPLGASLAQTQGDLAQANQRVSQLKAEVTAVNNQLVGLKDENLSMRSELDAVKAHFGILQVLVDVTTARLALVNDNAADAKAALTETMAKLDVLIPDIAKVDANLAESMPKRLGLILSGLDNDLQTAKTDLELLSGNLLNLETELFKK